MTRPAYPAVASAQGRDRHDQDRRAREVAAGDRNAVLAHPRGDLRRVVEPGRQAERREQRHGPCAHRREVGEVGGRRPVADVARRRPGEIEVHALDQDVGRNDGAVVEHGRVVADPEDDPAGRLPDGPSDRRDQHVLW
jgi:hypothetical protein